MILRSCSLDLRDFLRFMLRARGERDVSPGQITDSLRFYIRWKPRYAHRIICVFSVVGEFRGSSHRCCRYFHSGPYSLRPLAFNQNR